MTLPIEISILVGTHFLLAGIGWLHGKYVADKKKIKQFYIGLKPIVGLVSELRKKRVLDKEQAKKFIQTISSSFKDNFEIGTMLTHEFGEYDIRTKLECGICGDEEHKIARGNLCSDCELNCSIWNFK
ncbi:MAG: hypothetical protein U0Y08_03755 [Bacteroidia bacterium]